MGQTGSGQRRLVDGRVFHCFQNGHLYLDVSAVGCNADGRPANEDQNLWPAIACFLFMTVLQSGLSWSRAISIALVPTSAPSCSACLPVQGGVHAAAFFTMQCDHSTLQSVWTAGQPAVNLSPNFASDDVSFSPAQRIRAARFVLLFPKMQRALATQANTEISIAETRVYSAASSGCLPIAIL